MEILLWLETGARERQVKLAGTRPNKDLPQKIGEGSKHGNESTALAAKLTGTNRQYVSDAKQISCS